MNRIEKAFASKNALIGFVTAGDPSIEKSEEFILSLVEGGVDLIEIGIPFSDPVAEGAVIQQANARALAAGTTVDSVFRLVGLVRKRSQAPIVFLTYLNPVHFYGYARFMDQCRKVGVDGLIVPDLPFEEREELLPHCRENGIALISMIAPTSGNRIAMIARQAEGFIYCVSSRGVTGIREEFTTDLERLVEEIRRYATLPVAVGFGIATPRQAAEIGSFADGVIVGSAIVRIIGEHGASAAGPLREYAAAMKAALSKGPAAPFR